jgi:dipeptidyl aminopeptidase/acylaminoacyl peptidase
MFDPAAQAKIEKVKRALAGESVTVVSSTDSFDRMIVQTEGPGDSGTYFLVDLKLGTVKAIGWVYPTILQDNVAPVRTITYKAADGLQINGVLTLPLGRTAQNAPLIVMPHGSDVDLTVAGFGWWAQAYASRGYAVFQPNYRGSGGLGATVRQAGVGQWGRKMQSDISDGVAELARQGIIDPKRACIVGKDYGGYAALAGVTVQQGVYRCSVSVGGVADLNDLLASVVKRYGNTSDAVARIRREFGAKENYDTSLDAYSPRRLADKSNAPILLIYGKDDSIIDGDQSRNMADALRQAGKPVEVLQLPDDDHWLAKAATRTAMLEASVAFVEKYNPPDAAPAAK